MLSVVIPTFNREEALRRTLNCLALQTLSTEQFEVIVVNDGSTDDTERTLEQWKRKAPFALQTYTQENAGAGAARNKALGHVRGSVVLFLGDDMLPDTGCLQAHANFHEEKNNGMAAALGHIRWHEELKSTRFRRFLMRSGFQFKLHDLCTKKNRYPLHGFIPQMFRWGQAC